MSSERNGKKLLERTSDYFIDNGIFDFLIVIEYSQDYNKIKDMKFDFWKIQFLYKIDF